MGIKFVDKLEGPEDIKLKPAVQVGSLGCTLTLMDTKGVNWGIVRLNMDGTLYKYRGLPGELELQLDERGAIKESDYICYAKI